MAEAGLSLGYPELRKAIAHALGYGRTSANWSAAQVEDIDECLTSGLRRFYDPPLIAGRKHSWSFLSPIDTVTTVAATSEYTMEDDFGSVKGSLTFAANLGYGPVRYINESILRQQQMLTLSGKPEMFTIRPLSTDGTTGQRFQMVLYPTPDAAYVLSFRKRVLLNSVSTSLPYPYGGQQHAETILASCLAVVESRFDDQGGGPRYQDFMERLNASVMSDKDQMADLIGNNTDDSDGIPVPTNRNLFVTLGTVNGLTP